MDPHQHNSGDTSQPKQPSENRNKLSSMEIEKPVANKLRVESQPFQKDQPTSMRED